MTCDFGFAMQEILVKAFIKIKSEGPRQASQRTRIECMLQCLNQRSKTKDQELFILTRKSLNALSSFKEPF
ncbi:hypothetical protein BYT27DRAFT_7184090 [Phlegmacium glaucopus]|nr:hypothetical protein BYT27DRAFT_7184090 [Phlegmacium glaucopus]